MSWLAVALAWATTMMKNANVTIRIRLVSSVGMGEVGRLADGMLGIKRGRLCVERIDEGDQLAGLCVFDSGDRTGEGIRA